MELASKVRELIATQSEVSDLVAIGAYKPGNSPRYDAALARSPHLESFLVQRADEEVDQALSAAALRRLFSEQGT